MVEEHKTCCCDALERREETPPLVEIDERLE
jgi:hypothetical protein